MVVAAKALACALPRQLRLPLSRLQVPDIRAEAIRQGLVAEISGTTIWRWLSEDALRPWAHRSWIFPRDPDFQRKAASVLDLYARRFQGRRLGLDEYVLCADEKTSIQARRRRHPSAPPRPGQAVRVEHEYRRAGALAYLVAYDVHRARLFGRTERATGIGPFGRLVRQVMRQEPYRSARRVFWIVDNGSSHRGEAAGRRLAACYPNLVLVHLPVHASWLSQVEIYFSIVQRKVLTPNDCASLGELARRILAFQVRYEESASPFEWKFTRADLARPSRGAERGAPGGLSGRHNTCANLWARALSQRLQRPDRRPRPRAEGVGTPAVDRVPSADQSHNGAVGGGRRPTRVGHRRTRAQRLGTGANRLRFVCARRRRWYRRGPRGRGR